MYFFPRRFSGPWLMLHDVRSALLGRSSRPLEPSRSARIGLSSPLLNLRIGRWSAALPARSNWSLEPSLLRWAGRNSCSDFLGFAGNLKLALGLAGAIDFAARVRLDESTCETAVRKHGALVAMLWTLASVRLCSIHDICGFARVCIY